MARAKVERIKSLNRKLRRIPPAMERRINAARHKGANEMVALAQQLAPVESGELRASIASRVIQTTTDDTKAGAVMVFAGTDEIGWYARLVEFGTRPHAQPRRGTHHPGATARPFFFPAYRLLKKRIASRIKREATRGAKEASRGG